MKKQHAAANDDKKVGALDEERTTGDDTEMYEVERVLKRRRSRKTGKYEYLLKWKNYSSEHNSWEPEECLTSDLIEMFQGKKKQMHKRAEETQKRTERSHDKKSSKKKIKIEHMDDERQAEKIIGAKKDDDDELSFLIKWKDTLDADLVPAKVANLKYPQVVIRFYESIFEWN